MFEIIIKRIANKLSPDDSKETICRRKSGNDSLFVPPVGFDPVVSLFEFRMLFGLGKPVRQLTMIVTATEFSLSDAHKWIWHNYRYWKCLRVGE